jgi:hypothetical protein
LIFYLFLQVVSGHHPTPGRERLQAHDGIFKVPFYAEKNQNDQTILLLMGRNGPFVEYDDPFFLPG